MFSVTLAYTAQPYAEVMAMYTSVSYIPCATYSREQTSDLITFTQFEEVGLLSETCDNAEIGDKSDEDSIIPLLISEE